MRRPLLRTTAWAEEAAGETAAAAAGPAGRRRSTGCQGLGRDGDKNLRSGAGGEVKEPAGTEEKLAADFFYLLLFFLFLRLQMMDGFQVWTWRKRSPSAGPLGALSGWLPPSDGGETPATRRPP